MASSLINIFKNKSKSEILEKLMNIFNGVLEIKVSTADKEKTRAMIKDTETSQVIQDDGTITNKNNEHDTLQDMILDCAPVKTETLPLAYPVSMCKTNKFHTNTTTETRVEILLSILIYKDWNEGVC